MMEICTSGVRHQFIRPIALGGADLDGVAHPDEGLQAGRLGLARRRPLHHADLRPAASPRGRTIIIIIIVTVIIMTAAVLRQVPWSSQTTPTATILVIIIIIPILTVWP
jgi:hypothetical protein